MLPIERPHKDGKKIKLWSKLSYISAGTTAIGAAAALAPVIFQKHLAPTWEPFLVFGGLFVSFLSLSFLLVSAIKVFHNYFESIADSSAKTADAYAKLSSSRNVRLVHDHKSEISRKVMGADYVRNTFVCIESHDKSVSNPAKLYRDFFKSNPRRRWVDIIALSDTRSSRYKDMKDLPGLSVHLLKHSPPIINFIIIGGDDGDNSGAEVYFGWIGAPYSTTRKDDIPKVTVFCSSEPDIVNFFAQYFRTLRNTYGWANTKDAHLTVGPHGLQAVPLSDHPKKFVIKDGWWLTEMRSHPDAPPHLRAFLKIDFSYRNREDLHDIQVFIFDEAGDFYTNAAHGEALAHSRNDLYFKWKQTTKDEKRESGYCMYHFFADGDQDYLTGHVVANGVRERDLLYGRRMSVDEAIEIEARFVAMDNDSDYKKVVTKNDAAFLCKEMKRLPRVRVPDEDTETP